MTGVSDTKPNEACPNGNVGCAQRGECICKGLAPPSHFDPDLISFRELPCGHPVQAVILREGISGCGMCEAGSWVERVPDRTTNEAGHRAARNYPVERVATYQQGAEAERARIERTIEAARAKADQRGDYATEHVLHALLAAIRDGKEGNDA
ncbi:MAG: hypothetical protein JWL76_2003 [Thermoleophilia bacterium]|nr:hypothetical protein [Thermoleophilia bacterium]